MDNAGKIQRSKIEKIVIIAVMIVVLLGVAYMAYDYMTTMEQLENLNKEITGNSSLTNDPNINPDSDDMDT